ncbi:hypothetical protein KEM54_004607, partial [Ascosphaera aggregata]
MSIPISPYKRAQRSFTLHQPSPIYATAMTEPMLRPSKRNVNSAGGDGNECSGAAAAAAPARTTASTSSADEGDVRTTTTTTTTTTLTTAQSTLQIPELLSMIFERLALDGEGYFDATGRQTLLSSALVNKLWFQEAMRQLWTNPCGRLARPIPRLLGGVAAPERRAVYASRICGGSLYAYKRKFGDRDSMFMDEILDTIDFPKLSKIT